MRILIVEDDADDGFVAAELAEEGTVTVANDGREGLAIAEPAGFDLMLPGATGFEIGRQLRAGRRPNADPSRRVP